MATDILVGEALTLVARIGGADLVFALQSKDSVQNVRGIVDKAQITLTIESKHGQRARVRVQAPDSVRILKPEKQAA